MGQGGEGEDGRNLTHLHNFVNVNVLSMSGNKMAPVHDYEKHVM